MQALSWKAVLPRTRPTAVALGNFDGVHVGHQEIFTRLRATAKQWDLEPLAVSFHPHPRQYFFPLEPTSLLTPLEEKRALIQSYGIEFLPLAFESDTASLAPRDFIREVLQQKLMAEAVCMGPDHRFGKGALGDAALLGESLSGEERVIIVSPVQVQGIQVSSSKAKQALDSGNLEQLITFLGRPYALSGTVVRGQGRGAGLGFPTANIQLNDSGKACPGNGVYGCVAEVEGARYWAVMNLGTAPTVRGSGEWIEAHLLNFSGDLYGKSISLQLGTKLRDEMKFPDIKALKTQIARDIEIWKEKGIGYFPTGVS
jgi:riboflavin kinase/FMN adenylyltransferase